METRTLTTKRGLIVHTTLTNVEAIAAVAKLTATNDFARKLFRDYSSKRGLSSDQMTWVHKLALGDAAAPAKIDVGSMAGLIQLFDTAKLKLKFPKVRLTMPTGEPLCLSVAGPMSKTPGQINVTDGEKFGFNKFYGRISRDGQFAPSSTVPAGLADFLRGFADDPVRVAGEYGRLSGNCCFCGKTLDDERSTAVGYGPVCAKNFGLSWGTRKGWNQKELTMSDTVIDDGGAHIDAEEAELVAAGQL